MEELFERLEKYARVDKVHIKPTPKETKRISKEVQVHDVRSRKVEKFHGRGMMGGILAKIENPNDNLDNPPNTFNLK